MVEQSKGLKSSVVILQLTDLGDRGQQKLCSQIVLGNGVSGGLYHVY